MKTRLFLLSLVVASLVLSMSCSGGANENRGNRQGLAANQAPSPSNTPTPTPENQEENVRKLISDLAGALMKGDADALDRIYSDEYILITDTGRITTKPERMVMIRSGDLKFEKVAFEEVSVRVYGNSAVAVTRAFASSVFNGKAQSLEERVSLIAVKDGDAWRFVNAQVTPITAEPTSGNSSNSGQSNSIQTPNRSSGIMSKGNKP